MTALRMRRLLYRFALVALSLSIPFAIAVAYSSQEKKAADQDDTVRLHSDLVVLTVTVTDQSGQYAHGLNAKDFTLLEDEAPQTINSFSAEEAPFAAAILMDMSGEHGIQIRACSRRGRIFPRSHQRE